MEIFNTEKQGRREGWRTVKLGEVAILKRGKYVTRNSTRPGTIPVILGGQEPAYYCDESNHDGPCVVISRSGASAGHVTYWNEPIFVTDGFLFEATELTTNHFLFYSLKANQGHLRHMQNGTGIPHVRGEELKVFPISLPPLATQRRIAAVLGALDDKIELNRKMNANLEAQAQSLFKSWFVDFEPWGGVRPKEWRVGTLGELVEVCYGKDHKKLADGKTPVYGSGGLMRYVDRSLYDEESVLIPRKGTLNNIMYSCEPFWTVDTMFYTKMRVPNVAKFVFLFMKGKDMSAMNTGSAVPSMTTDILNGLPVLMPEQKTLNDFEKRLRRYLENTD